MQKASQLAPRDILMVNVTAVIGTHIGPNGLGFGGSEDVALPAFLTV